jgi:lysophospholipase L1-like esterase
MAWRGRRGALLGGLFAVLLVVGLRARAVPTTTTAATPHPTIPLPPAPPPLLTVEEAGLVDHSVSPILTGVCPVAGTCRPRRHARDPELGMTRISDRHKKIEEGAEAKRLRTFLRQLRGPGGVVEDPCAQPGRGCGAALLEPFYAALDDSRRGQTARVAVFGNSLIASDRIIDVLRRRLIEQFGDAGPGFILPERIAPYGGRDRSAAVATGWFPRTVADIERHPWGNDVPFGMSGVFHISLPGGASSLFKLHGHSTATLFVFEPPAKRPPPPLRWRVDQGPWQELPAGPARAEVPPLADEQETSVEQPAWVLSMPRLEFPAGTKTFGLRTAGPGVVVQGLVLEQDGGGIVVDTLGVPGVDTAQFLTADPVLFTAQLAARDPDLVVVMLGGNETKRIAWGRYEDDKVEENLRAFLARVKDSTRGACLVVGPIDAVINKEAGAHGDPMRPRPQLTRINHLHRAVALTEDCAYLDLYEAMGGAGSLKRFLAAGVLHDDLVHPKGRGLDVLGQIMADALLDAYRATPPPEQHPFLADAAQGG